MIFNGSQATSNGTKKNIGKADSYKENKQYKNSQLISFIFLYQQALSIAQLRMYVSGKHTILTFSFVTVSKAASSLYGASSAFYLFGLSAFSNAFPSAE